MADEFTLDVDVSDAINAMEGVEESAKDTGPLMETISDILREGVLDNFANEEGPDGPWVELADATKEERQKKGYTGKKLQRTRGLYNSIMGYSTSNSAEVATNKVYAPLQFLGGTPDMPPGPADVPARNAMWINDDTEEEIDAEADEHFDVD